MQIILRPDQQRVKDGIYDAWQNGARNVLAVKPTGGGKSIVVSDIVLDCERQGGKQAVIAHRTELVDQMSMHVARRGIKHRIIGSSKTVSQIIAKHRKAFQGQSFVSPTANCSVASIDTLIARSADLERWAQQIDRWTIDEAHHVLRSNKWGRGVAMFPRAYGLGVTATPQRADGAGLGSHADGVFDAMVLGMTPRQLMEIGAITDYEYVAPESDFRIDENDFTDNGDLSPKKGREASKKSHIVGDVVTNYIKYAYGKRAIAFATDVETAGEIAENFKAYGIPAAAVSAKTPPEVRDDIIERFKAGQYWVLVNVDLFGEGFDVPSVFAVIMARPTASLAVFLQQCGRAFRAIEGKLYGLIIDHVSNYKRHGWPDKYRAWTLDRREKRAKRLPDPEEIELVVCKKCTKVYERVNVACPHCGAVPEITPVQRRDIEQVDGDLILLDRETLARMREATELASPADVANRAAFVAGDAAGRARANSQIERIQSQQRLKDVIAMWAGMQTYKGRSDQDSYRRFYLTLGVDVLSALALPRADMDKLSDQIEGWIR